MSSQNSEVLFNNIKKIYDAGHGYHTLRFPNGLVIDGRWDMAKYLHHYKIPEDLSGKTVLDIGPANGYFSFEFAKRGADVTAIDMYDDCWSEDLNKLMNTDVKFVKKNITTIDESFGKFDIVFCSNMLQHHSDLPGNIERIKKVTKNMAILCTGIYEGANDESLTNLKQKIFQKDKKQSAKNIPLAYFVGGPGGGGGGKYLGFYWKPNMKCFEKIAEYAGFTKVEQISKFWVKRKGFMDSFLGVIHCYT